MQRIVSGTSQRMLKLTGTRYQKNSTTSIAADTAKSTIDDIVALIGMISRGK